MLSLILKHVSVEMFLKAFVILIMPIVLKLLLSRYISCSLELQYKTAAMVSAASSPTLLLLIINCVKVETFCKAVAILIMPTVLRLLFPRHNFFNLMFCDKTVAISSDASSPTLLLY